MSDITLEAGSLGSSTLKDSFGSSGGNASVEKLQARLAMLELQLAQIQEDADSNSSSTSSAVTEAMIENLENQIEQVEEQLEKAQAKERVQSKSTEEAPPEQPGKSRPVTLEISEESDNMNRFQNAVESMDEDEKSELKDLLNEAKTLMRSGVLDPETLEAEASDELKDALSQYGLDLKSILEDVQEDHDDKQRRDPIDYVESVETQINGDAADAPPSLLVDMLSAILADD